MSEFLLHFNHADEALAAQKRLENAFEQIVTEDDVRSDLKEFCKKHNFNVLETAQEVQQRIMMHPVTVIIPADNYGSQVWEMTVAADKFEDINQAVGVGIRYTWTECS